MHSVRPSLQRARVVRAWTESSALHGLAFVGEGLAERHVAPGQFVEVSPGPGLIGHFALANEPGARELELLFKRGGKVADLLAGLSAGDDVAATAPGGLGFPLDDHRGRDLILCAAGSGIAPLRSVIRNLLPRRRDFGAITLYYSQRAPSEFAYVEEYPAWRRADIVVVQLVSGGGHPWPGLSGRVQDAVAAAPIDVGNAVAYLCGMRPMIHEVSRVLDAKGLDPRRIFLNH